MFWCIHQRIFKLQVRRVIKVKRIKFLEFSLNINVDDLIIAWDPTTQLGGWEFVAILSTMIQEVETKTKEKQRQTIYSEISSSL